MAGLEEPADPFPGEPSDEVARAMRAHALTELETADYVVLVEPVGPGAPPLGLPREPDLIVRSKLDLWPGGEELAGGQENELVVSAATGAGMPDLRQRLDAFAFGAAGPTSSLALNARHLQEIAAARAALGRVIGTPAAPAELVAADFRESLDALGRILGNISPDDLLGRIFSAFCIGK